VRRSRQCLFCFDAAVSTTCPDSLKRRTVGAVGIVAPPSFVWIAQQFASSGAFYAIATIRVAFGLVLISVASAWQFEHVASGTFM
jgi:hypothetical protein